MCSHALPERHVKTGKNHQCWGCTKVIQKGTPNTWKLSGVTPGEGFWNGYYCADCERYINFVPGFFRANYDDGEGLYFGHLLGDEEYELFISGKSLDPVKPYDPKNIYLALAAVILVVNIIYIIQLF